MSASTRKVILFIAVSLDGYIAKPGDDLSFLSIVEKEGEDYGYSRFVSKVDTVIMGRSTYDWIMTQVPEFPHADKESYIITHTPKASIGSTTFYTGELSALIANLKAAEGKNIFVDGGAEIVNELLKHELIDEFYISIIPVLLGEGVRLFKDGRPEQGLKLVSATAFEKGLAQLHYTKL